MHNASSTMVRKATELDVGSRVVYEGAIRTIAAIQDLIGAPYRNVVTMRFEDGSSTMTASSDMFVCLAAE